MRVTRNNETHFVDWKYENPDLERILEVNGISMTEYREQGGKAIMERLNKDGEVIYKSLPAPRVTTCVIRREDKSVVYEASVTRHFRTAPNKEDARKFSLKKALTYLYPGYENKATRTDYWNAYLKRPRPKTVKEVQPV
jgi:hypothetical protein